MTAINASSEEVSSWIENRGYEHAEDSASGEARFVESQEATSSGNNSTVTLSSKGGSLVNCSKKENFSFICECFFMTARVLNLGLMKALSDFKHIAQVLIYLKHPFLLFLYYVSKFCILIESMHIDN